MVMMLIPSKSTYGSCPMCTGFTERGLFTARTCITHTYFRIIYIPFPFLWFSIFPDSQKSMVNDHIQSSLCIVQFSFPLSLPPLPKVFYLFLCILSVYAGVQSSLNLLMPPCLRMVLSGYLRVYAWIINALSIYQRCRIQGQRQWQLENYLL